MIKKFEDYLIKEKPKIFRFGEYRKGSNEYGEFIQELMMFLRNFKKDNEDNLIFKTKQVKVDLEKLYKLLNDKNKSRLISFDIKFTNNKGNYVDKPDINGYIIFSNLNKKDNRPWEKKKYE